VTRVHIQLLRTTSEGEADCNRRNQFLATMGQKIPFARVEIDWLCRPSTSRFAGSPGIGPRFLLLPKTLTNLRNLRIFNPNANPRFVRLLRIIVSSTWQSLEAL